ncbi:RraA family protein [Microlunatus elymi]|uniref:RraA family protein n=1 Tax=Microlunatus elymi TaxID=2596828 RepID=UPI001AEFBEC2|nr:RraA family protein [Microlunatus elymi]
MTNLPPSSAVLDDRVTSAQLSDSLDALGERGHVMSAAIRPLRPGARIVGRARTIRFEPIAEPAEVVYQNPDPYRPFIEFMDGVQQGDMIVVGTGGDQRSAYWGELFSAAAIGRGAIGVICDSYTRDRPKVEALGFPVFSAGTRPLDYRARMRIESTQQPITCADVQVSPGDLVLADDDGIVVVPEAVREQTVRRANERATTESTVLDELLGGRTLGEVWNAYGVL